MVLAIVGMFLLPGMDAIAKLISQAGDMSPGQLNFFRFAVQAVVFGGYIALVNGVRALWPKRLWINLLRGALLATASLFFFIAIKYMPLADAIAVFFVEPLILTVLSAVVLRETVGKRRIIAVIAGFIGALIVIQPSFSIFGPVSLLPLCTATFFATYLLLNRVAGVVDTANSMQFVSGVSGTAVMGLYIMIGQAVGLDDLSFQTAISVSIWVLVLCMSLIGVAGHLLIVLSFRMAPASLLAPFQYTEIVSAALLGLLLFSEFPTPSKWLGIIIIVASGLFVFWREQKVAD